MTQIDTIKTVYANEFRHLYIYKFMYRWQHVLKPVYLVSFLITLAIAPYDAWPLTYWAAAFIGIITLGGIDHFYIGLRLKHILRILHKEYNIDISLGYLLHICEP
jgi:hypothetical protein